jgi:hypothetical protein
MLQVIGISFQKHLFAESRGGLVNCPSSVERPMMCSGMHGVFVIGVDDMSSYLRLEHDAKAQRIVETLQRLQFVHPHDPIRTAVETASRQIGFCPEAARYALTWLGLDTKTAIGRLRRSELLQLARSIRRFWRQNAGHWNVAAASASQEKK